MQANRNIRLGQKKAPIYKLPRSKAPKTQQICHHRHARLFLEHFYGMTWASTLALENNFANLGSFAKVSVPVRSIIPCYNLNSTNKSCRMLFYRVLTQVVQDHQTDTVP